jgi:hypothetical protein
MVKVGSCLPSFARDIRAGLRRLRRAYFDLLHALTCQKQPLMLELSQCCLFFLICVVFERVGQAMPVRMPRFR